MKHNFESFTFGSLTFASMTWVGASILETSTRAGRITRLVIRSTYQANVVGVEPTYQSSTTGIEPTVQGEPNARATYAESWIDAYASYDADRTSVEVSQYLLPACDNETFLEPTYSANMTDHEPTHQASDVGTRPTYQGVVTNARPTYDASDLRMTPTYAIDRLTIYPR